MDRLACADLPAFPLQILLSRETSWRGLPAAVVEEDRAQGRILWVNERARRAGVLPGHRYARALSLASELRAGVVPREEIGESSRRIADALRRLTPDVEPYANDAGAFFLSGAGLSGLFRSASAWGRSIRAALRDEGFESAVVVGFTRFGAYAVAKRGERLVTFEDLDAERRAAREVPLDRLGLAPELRDFLAKLGVRTVGDYLALPPEGLLLRFGDEAAKLHEIASGTLWDPLRPEAPVMPVEERIVLDDHPEGDSARLVFVIKGALVRLLAELAARGQALAALYVGLELERVERRADATRANVVNSQEELIRPAEPTLDAGVLLRLLHLRLESSPPSAAVREVRLRVAAVPARAEQLDLFRHMQRRDLRAAAEAIAQLRADLGNDAVQKAVLRDGHLPEAQFGWEPLDSVPSPKPRPSGERSLVRRLHTKPLPLSVAPRGEVAHGPYVVSGGWWRAEVTRQYVFVETERGACLWLYYDERRGRWFLQGLVE